MNLVNVRRSGPDEAATISRLFTETVHTVNSKDYGRGQLFAWAPRPPGVASWRERLGGEAIVFVAERENELVGFASFTLNGHVEYLYTHAAALRLGVASALMRRVEDEARARGISRLFAEVSITARPFFDRAGFRVITRQTVQRWAVAFVNFRMEKLL